MSHREPWKNWKIRGCIVWSTRSSRWEETVTGTRTGSLFWAHAAVSQTPLDCDTSGSPDRGASGMHALPDGVSGLSMSHVTAPTCVLRALLLFTFALHQEKLLKAHCLPNLMLHTCSSCLKQTCLVCCNSQGEPRKMLEKHQCHVWGSSCFASAYQQRGFGAAQFKQRVATHDSKHESINNGTTLRLQALMTVDDKLDSLRECSWHDFFSFCQRKNLECRSCHCPI